MSQIRILLVVCGSALLLAACASDSKGAGSTTRSTALSTPTSTSTTATAVTSTTSLATCAVLYAPGQIVPPNTDPSGSCLDKTGQVVHPTFQQIRCPNGGGTLLQNTFVYWKADAGSPTHANNADHSPLTPAQIAAACA